MEASIARSSEQRKAEEALQSADGEHKKVTANREAALERRDDHKLVEESGKALEDAQAAKDESDQNDPAALQKAEEELEATRVQSRNHRRAAEEAKRVAEQLEAEQTNRRELDAAPSRWPRPNMRSETPSRPAARRPRGVARKDHAEALVKHAEAAAAKRRADVKLHAARPRASASRPRCRRPKPVSRTSGTCGAITPSPPSLRRRRERRWTG